MTDRFRVTGTYLSEFAREFLVECPRCAHCAVVRHRAPAAGSPASDAVLTCVTCGHSAARPAGTARLGVSFDAYFGLPLWLRGPCCGETLWAYNAEHLTYLEEHVAARLRERVPHPVHGWANKSMASRLPRWMTQAGHREAVLGCIARLRADRLREAPI